MGLEAVLPGPQNALYVMLCYMLQPRSPHGAITTANGLPYVVSIDHTNTMPCTELRILPTPQKFSQRFENLTTPTESDPERGGSK